MKSKFLFAVCIFFIGTAFSVRQNPGKDLLGVWKLHSDYIDQVSLSVINSIAKTDPKGAAKLEAGIDELKDVISKTTFIYNEDHTYIVSMPRGPQSSRWALSADGKQLIISKNGQPDRYDEILELSAVRLLIANKERGDTALYIRP